MLFEAGGVIAFIVFALWVWAVVDCITTDSARCRNLPKGVWLVIVIVLFDLGAILWLLLGRPANKHWRPATGSDWSAPRRAVGPEDTAHFDTAITDRRSAELDRQLASWEAEQPAAHHPSLSSPASERDAKEAELAAREEDLRRRELELRRREPDAGGADHDGG